MKKYDSAQDIRDHIWNVQLFLWRVVKNLELRSNEHDRSKLDEPEKSLFDEYTPLLRDSTYGSPEYKEFLTAMKVGIDHHYSVNRHHPEFHTEGIRGMSFLDLIEMLVDWKAATMRHENGDIRKSIEINQERFGYSDELKQIMINTLDELGML